MRGLAQALLLAPALVGAAPSRIDEKVKGEFFSVIIIKHSES